VDIFYYYVLVEVVKLVIQKTKKKV